MGNPMLKSDFGLDCPKEAGRDSRPRNCPKEAGLDSRPRNCPKEAGLKNAGLTKEGWTQGRWSEKRLLDWTQERWTGLNNVGVVKEGWTGIKAGPKNVRVGSDDSRDCRPHANAGQGWLLNSLSINDTIVLSLYLTPKRWTC
ncbi:hypothetical protein Ddc_16887 [Ditylenchus destructor]|nr:hypothetical protein Ddc_16887 [Ditylenchus destructor]